MKHQGHSDKVIDKHLTKAYYKEDIDYENEYVDLDEEGKIGRAHV